MPVGTHDAWLGLVLAPRLHCGQHKEVLMDSALQDVRFAFRQLVKPRLRGHRGGHPGPGRGRQHADLQLRQSSSCCGRCLSETSRTVMIFATHPERGGSEWRALRRFRRVEARQPELRGPRRLFPPHLQPDRGRRSSARPGSLAPPRASSRSGISRRCTAGSFRTTTIGRVRCRVALLEPRVLVARVRGRPGDRGRALSLDGAPHVVVGVLTPRIEIGT